MNNSNPSSDFAWQLMTQENLSQDLPPSVDPAALQAAESIVEKVRRGGESALREIAVQLGDRTVDEPLIISREELQASLDQLPEESRDVLTRVAERIRAFATAQRATLRDCEVAVASGTAGHTWHALDSAGCYAPGGRYPLPSSVLMTAITARVAGVRNVWVASPRPSLETLAAAAIAGADGLLAVGGAQAIAALTYGIPNVIPRCSIIVGPGNRWVTAAKAIVSRETCIDMLAGPSELVVVAGEDASPAVIAADLLAQAEHDVDARPILVTDSASLAEAVGQEISRQLESLKTAPVARQAFANGGYFLIESVAEALAICGQIAPEHLSIQGQRFEQVADQFYTCGAMFIGPQAGEVFGDYGVGPNHVLPTGGTARFHHGLWVGSFMRFHTWLKMDSNVDASLVSDTITLAQMEGLHAHSRSAEMRG